MTTANELERDMRLIEVALGVQFDHTLDQRDVTKRILDAIDTLRIRAMSGEKVDKRPSKAECRNRVNRMPTRSR